MQDYGLSFAKVCKKTSFFITKVPASFNFSPFFLLIFNSFCIFADANN